VAVVLVSSLTGCSAVETVTDFVSDPVILPCPDYRVVAEALTLTKFKEGPGRDLIDVDYEGGIEAVKLGCESQIDKKTKIGKMEIDVTVLFKASRGAANRNHKASFPYFIRVLDRTGKILWGEDLMVNIGFPGNKTRLLFSADPVTLVIPISPRWSSKYYRILTGFKMTREELQFNRERRQKTLK